MEDTKIDQGKSTTLPDESNNLILSRADWRFLLSNQNPKRSVVFARGILVDAVEMISESIVIGGSDYQNDDCDLAVAVDPDNETLKKAWSFLQPGGSIYIEWILGPFSRIRSIKTKLEAIGFQDVTFYMPKPDPSDSPSEIWIPLVPNVVAYYLLRIKCENKKEHMLKQLRKGICRLMCLISPNVFTIYPWLMNTKTKKYKVCSIAYKPHLTNATTNSPPHTTVKPESATNMPDIVDACLSSLDRYDKSKEISILMLTERGGFERIILFVFAGYDSNPTFVIKIPRTSVPGSSLEREAKVLKALKKGFQAIEGIPRILFEGYEYGIASIGETFINGTEIYNVITESTYQDLAMKMTLWLAQFAQQTKTSCSQNLKDSYKEQIVTNFIELYSSVLTPFQINQIYKTLEKLEPKFRVCVHNDLGPWNVLIDSDGKLGVIDWELGHLNGLPLTDLIMFIIWMCFQIEETYKSRHYRQSYRNILDLSTSTGRVFEYCLRHYSEKLDIPFSDIGAYRLLTLLIQARIEIPQLIADKQSSDEAIKSLEDGFYLQLVKEELLHTREF